MDQIKIGKFIAELRKERNLTQREFAEILGLSDKTVSKWECGNGIPEVSLMPALCSALGITLNELFSGMRLSRDDYILKAEENMISLVQQAENIKKILSEDKSPAEHQMLIIVPTISTAQTLNFGTR